MLEKNRDLLRQSRELKYKMEPIIPKKARAKLTAVVKGRYSRILITKKYYM